MAEKFRAVEKQEKEPTILEKLKNANDKLARILSFEFLANTQKTLYSLGNSIRDFETGDWGDQRIADQATKDANLSLKKTEEVFRYINRGFRTEEEEKMYLEQFGDKEK